MSERNCWSNCNDQVNCAYLFYYSTLNTNFRYNNRHYKIHDILWELNPMLVFNCKGVEITLIEYYKNVSCVVLLISTLLLPTDCLYLQTKRLII